MFSWSLCSCTAQDPSLFSVPHVWTTRIEKDRFQHNVGAQCHRAVCCSIDEALRQADKSLSRAFRARSPRDRSAAGAARLATA
jgi:hypothetical protein